MSRNLELKDYVSSDFEVYFISYKNGIISIKVRCILKYLIRSTKIMDVEFYMFDIPRVPRIILNSFTGILKIT